MYVYMYSVCLCAGVSINIECKDTLGCRILSSGCKQILCVFLGCSCDKEAAAVQQLAQVSRLSLASPLSCKLCTQFFFLLFPVPRPSHHRPPPPNPSLTHTICTFLPKAAITSPRRGKRFSHAAVFSIFFF